MKRLGVIAEDVIDCRALTAIARRVFDSDPQGRSIGVERRSDRGAAKLMRKARRWMNDLARVGCSHIVILRDLDRNPATGGLNDEDGMLRRLEQIQVPEGVERLICVPVEEIEAWFWSDPKIVADIGRCEPKDYPNPHLIAKPKERLMRLSAKRNRKPRYNPTQNAKYAAKLDFQVCMSRCPSFARLHNFLQTMV